MSSIFFFFACCSRLLADSASICSLCDAATKWLYTAVGFYRRLRLRRRKDLHLGRRRGHPRRVRGVRHVSEGALQHSLLYMALSLVSLPVELVVDGRSLLCKSR